MIRQNPIGNFMAAGATPQPATSQPTPSAPAQSTLTPSQPSAPKKHEESFSTPSYQSQSASSMQMSSQSKPSQQPASGSYMQQPTTASSTMYQHHDDEGQSLYNMYGFKQNEGNIQDVFKFLPAAKNMLITENCKFHFEVLPYFRV